MCFYHGMIISVHILWLIFKKQCNMMGWSYAKEFAPDPCWWFKTGKRNRYLEGGYLVKHVLPIINYNIVLNSINLSNVIVVDTHLLLLSQIPLKCWVVGIYIGIICLAPLSTYNLYNTFQTTVRLPLSRYVVMFYSF